MEWFLIFLIILFLVLLKKFNILKNLSSGLKGKWGESTVKYKIGKDILGEIYSIHNFQVSFDNKTFQVDHIVINKHGVYVFETKNYSGMIYGNDVQQQWTQVLAYGNTKNRFYNPVKQNNTHIYYLSQILNMSHIPFANYVVFVGCDISNVSSYHVIGPKDIDTVLNIPINDFVLSPSDIDVIYNKLISYQSSKSVSNSEHISNIHSTQTDIRNNVCPRCGKQLVLRCGPYGKFYACSGYPSCTFKKK